MQARRLLLVGLAAALVAGCGGSGRLSKSAYEQRLQADGKPLPAIVAKLAGNPGSAAQLAKDAATAQAAVSKAADDLASVKPPTDAVDDNARIVTALRAISAQLGKLKKAAASGDLATVQAAATAIQSSPEVKAGQKAIEDLKQKGYTVGALGT